MDSPSPQMAAVVMTQPMGTVRPGRAPQNVRPWSSRMFKCGLKECCLATFCFPCNAGALGRTVENVCPCLTGCFCLPFVRTELRTLYGIKGSICGDICWTECCPCCVVMQMDREVALLKDANLL